MWNVACKDPLEAERVGERRERKLRQANRNAHRSNSSVSSEKATTLGLGRATLRDSGSSTSIPTISTAASSPLYDTSSDPSIRIIPKGSHNGGPAGSVRMRPEFHRPDSTRSNALGRSGQGDEKFELARERLEAGWRTFPEEPLDRKNPRDGVEATTDFRGKAKSTMVRPRGVMTQTTSTSKYPPKSRSWAEVAAHLEAEEDPRRQVHFATSTSMIRFQRLLQKIELATAQVSCKRLSERWEDDDQDLEAEFRFETALWVLVGLEKICAIAQSNYLETTPSYCVDGPSMVQVRDGMHVLHLAPVHDSPGAWLMGAKHSLTNFCSFAREPSSFDLPSSRWGWPSNVESNLWDSCPIILKPDNSFDAVFIEPIFHVLSCTDWPVLIKEAFRVLAPGNCLVVQVMDPVPKRAGPLLETWTTQHLTLGLARKFMVSRPNLLLPGWLEEFAAPSEMVVEAIEFPIIASLIPQGIELERQGSPSSLHNTNRKASRHNPLDATDKNPAAQKRREEVQTYASLVGKHLYQSMYKDLAPLEITPTLDKGSQPQSSRFWWWDDPAILEECQRFDPAFELVMYICRKGEAFAGEE